MAANESDLALEELFSRHRPLFLMDLQAAGQPQMTMSPWFQSASGEPLNPDIEAVPIEVVDNLTPFQEQREVELDDEPDLYDDPIMALAKLDTQEQNMNPEQDYKGPMLLKLRGMMISLTSANSATVTVIKRNGKKGQSPIVEKYLISTNQKEEGDVAEDENKALFGEDYSVSPSSTSFLRPSIQATSVKRKRRIKMNRHKYKKRRKAQRALRRKLGK